MSKSYYPIKTARFWFFINGGWVKLSIPLNTAMPWSKYERTDEGWRAIWYCWTYLPRPDGEGNEVTFEYDVRERDCDGQYDTGGAETCRDKELRSVLSLTEIADPDRPPLPGLLPNWQEESSEYRDYAAEAAGY